MIAIQLVSRENTNGLLFSSFSSLLLIFHIFLRMTISNHQLSSITLPFRRVQNVHLFLNNIYESTPNILYFGFCANSCFPALLFNVAASFIKGLTEHVMQYAHYFSYLLQHNQLPQNSVAESNHFYFAHDLVMNAGMVWLCGHFWSTLHWLGWENLLPKWRLYSHSGVSELLGLSRVASGSASFLPLA